MCIRDSSKTNETDKIIQKKMGKDRLYSETGIQKMCIRDSLKVEQLQNVRVFSFYI